MIIAPPKKQYGTGKSTKAYKQFAADFTKELNENLGTFPRRTKRLDKTNNVTESTICRLI